MRSRCQPFNERLDFRKQIVKKRSWIFFFDANNISSEIGGLRLIKYGITLRHEILQQSRS